MKFHSYAFRTPFANLGSAMRNVAEAEIAVSRLLQIRAPKVALVGVDFWWFHPGRDQQEEFPEHSRFRPQPARIIGLPFRWGRCHDEAMVECTTILSRCYLRAGPRAGVHSPVRGS